MTNTYFDQKGQNVTYQFNAAGNINFGDVQNKKELVDELRKLLVEVIKATQAGITKEEISVDVESHIRKAEIELRKPEPQKEKVVGHINGAKSLLEGVTAAAELVSALVKAATLVGGFIL